jgi:hypothetical protein
MTFIKLLFPTFFCMASTLGAQEPIDKNVMKALYIKTIIPYITWDKKEENSKFRIAFLGKPKVGRFLEQILEDDSINMKRVQFLTVSADELYEPFDILIIDEELLNTVKKIHPYTFSIVDTNEKINTNEIILIFKMIDDRLKFSVNFNALYKSRVKLSSRLLKIAYSEEKDN